ncbi:MAG TPA: RNA polymerase sigma factor [Bacteroidales bacterium]|nr:RNA polymerase sigma factor [Bacteroidota bacterium]OPZ57976.1 MAG: ECF RNA polymerase sigma factor SigW [Bacteroidetes bacterium ADurb.BinA012]HPO39638.1 RNA polymerase sigma factor [Bacteroidales bacterium]HQL45498.1 RNA polymerase sigma factor [Bacteroidales bacterium]
MATPDIHIHDRLIDECREGNRRAQFRLYELYSKAMFNTAYRIMGNREDAEDMLQEAFTDCFRKIGSYRTESTFGAWLKTIVINRCISRLRKREAELVFIDDYSRHEMQQDEPQEMIWPDPSVIARAVERLPDGYRVVFSLYLLEGYDHTEISQILGISESTSKTQYSRAKERLKKILSEMRRDG